MIGECSRVRAKRQTWNDLDHRAGLPETLRALHRAIHCASPVSGYAVLHQTLQYFFLGNQPQVHFHRIQEGAEGSAVFAGHTPEHIRKSIGPQGERVSF